MFNQKKSYEKDNILIVDDVTANLLALNEMISNAGYIPRPVKSVSDAMKAIQTLTPSLILLDISMPEIDGFEYCTMLKKDVRTRDIPIIFISALGTKEDKMKGLQLGAVDFFTKPFEFEEIALRIDIHLKNSKKIRELTSNNQKLYKLVNEQIRKQVIEQKNIIYSFMKLADKREHNDEAHIEKIAMNSRLLAMSLKFSPYYMDQITNSFIDCIEIAAPLYDIGNLSIQDTILHNKDQLSLEEEEILQSHTILGANTLKDIYHMNEYNEYLKMAMDIALYHHEKWDGTGYPYKLSENRIPIAARIVAIVDTYTQLMRNNINQTNDYKEQCIQYMKDEAGKSFDPIMLGMFLKVEKQFV